MHSGLNVLAIKVRDQPNLKLSVIYMTNKHLKCRFSLYLQVNCDQLEALVKEIMNNTTDQCNDDKILSALSKESDHNEYLKTFTDLKKTLLDQIQGLHSTLNGNSIIKALETLSSDIKLNNGLRDKKTNLHNRQLEEENRILTDFVQESEEYSKFLIDATKSIQKARYIFYNAKAELFKEFENSSDFLLEGKDRKHQSIFSLDSSVKPIINARFACTRESASKSYPKATFS